MEVFKDRETCFVVSMLSYKAHLAFILECVRFISPESV